MNAPSFDPQLCTVSISNSVGTIHIQRPAKKNALTKELCLSLAEQFRRLDRLPEVKVIALRGSGPDFCAGADIHEVETVLDDQATGSHRTDHLSLLDSVIGQVSKPTVALVQGVCMGGGWQLASSCDLVICSEDAHLALTPSKLGLLYPQRGLERLVEQVGAHRAKYLLFSSDRIAPWDAERWGLVTTVIPASDFEAWTTSFLERIAQRSQYTVHHSKRLIDAGAEQTDAHRRDWEETWAGMLENPDLVAGRAAFFAGEQPVFTWGPKL